MFPFGLCPFIIVYKPETKTGQTAKTTTIFTAPSEHTILAAVAKISGFLNSVCDDWSLVATEIKQNIPSERAYRMRFFTAIYSSLVTLLTCRFPIHILIILVLAPFSFTWKLESSLMPTRLKINPIFVRC